MIKFVYFDVGGVVIKDFSATDKWEMMIQELGIPKTKIQEFNDFWKKEANNSSLDLVTDSLLPLISKHFNVEIPKDYSLLLNGFIDRFEKNTSIWPVIEEITSQTKVGLLTNMYPNMFKAIEEKGLFPPVKWTSIVDSSVVMLQKPDREIFEYAQKTADVKGEEILFVDNSEEHTNAAKAFGWQTYYYDSMDYETSSKDLLSFFKINYE